MSVSFWFTSYRNFNESLCTDFKGQSAFYGTASLNCFFRSPTHCTMRWEITKATMVQNVVTTMFCNSFPRSSFPPNLTGTWQGGTWACTLSWVGNSLLSKWQTWSENLLSQSNIHLCEKERVANMHGKWNHLFYLFTIMTTKNYSDTESTSMQTKHNSIWHWQTTHRHTHGELTRLVHP